MRAFVCLEHHSDRVLFAELAGDIKLGAVQFIDDMTAPRHDAEHAVAIIGQHRNSACSRYAQKARASFNYVPAKTAVLPLFTCHLPDAANPGCPVVSTKRIWGILFDCQMSFLALLQEVWARGWSVFQTLYFATQSGGFSVPLLLDQVEARVVPLIPFPAAFLFTADGAIPAFDRLQLRWARYALGPPCCAEVRHALLLLQCGWPYRLSTRVIEEAILALVRLRVLPPDSPGAQMLRIAEAHERNTWFHVVSRVLHLDMLCKPIQGIHRHHSGTAAC